MAKVGDTKTIHWQLAAKDLDYDLTKIVTVRGFIAAACLFAKNNAGKIISALCGGVVVDVALFVATFADLAFSRVAEETGHEGIDLTIVMEYTSWSKHQGGRVITVYGWKVKQVTKCAWY